MTDGPRTPIDLESNITEIEQPISTQSVGGVETKLVESPTKASKGFMNAMSELGSLDNRLGILAYGSATALGGGLVNDMLSHGDIRGAAVAGLFTGYLVVSHTIFKS